MPEPSPPAARGADTGATAPAAPACGFRLLAHPADIGLGFWGPSREEAFVQAAAGLRQLLAGAAPAHPTQLQDLAVDGEDTPDLLYNWLSEILLRFDAEQTLVDACTIVHLDEHRLVARVEVEPYDPDRHDTPYYVKAITYHQLELVQEQGGWHGQVFVDI